MQFVPTVIQHFLRPVGQAEHLKPFPLEAANPVFGIGVGEHKAGSIGKYAAEDRFILRVILNKGIGVVFIRQFKGVNLLVCRIDYKTRFQTFQALLSAMR